MNTRAKLKRIYAFGVILTIFKVVCGGNDADKTNLEYKNLTTNNDTYLYYPIEDIKNENEIFLQFEVKAERDAYIIFSSTKNQDNFFKVFFGTDQNKYYFIRASDDVEAVRAYGKNVLSSKEWRQFWIRITLNGTFIEVGKNGSSDLMNMQITEPKPIKYFGFASSDTTADWKFLSLEKVLVPAGCTDMHGRSVTPGIHYLPGPDICQLCVCSDNNTPKWCKRVLCSPPQNCKSFVMGSSCCDYSCLDNTIQNGEDFRDEVDRENAENPCIPTPCGPNSECRRVNNFAACSCQKNFIGVPPECKAECNTDSDCAPDKTCIGQKCQDPCITACGQNARCQVVNHTRTCSCLPEFAGNALIKCVKQPKPVKDLCCPSPCGPNSECRQVNNYAACSCKENYIGLPPLCRPECIEDSVCPQSKACIQQKCQDPCIAACGQNAQCLVVNHTRKCECLPGYTGDPLVKCVGEEQLYEKCHTILKTRHYNYAYFFPIRKRDDNNIELKFKVKANRDAHMLFSQDVFPKNKDTAYEIILGAWNNTGAIIRKTRYDPNTVATKVDDGMLSLNEWREFWIEITNKDNTSKIEIGRKGKSAFLSSEDSKHLPIEYYAVAGSNNATVLWSLPCVEFEDSP